MTVLANEQVIDGRGWRSGALVEQRELTQWFFKISDYAEDLLAALDTLDRWPEKVRIMQRNWIGKSEGLRCCSLRARSKTTPSDENELEVFTTRPDTIFGATFIALSPDHPLATAAAKKNPKLAAFVDECHRMGTVAETRSRRPRRRASTPACTRSIRSIRAWTLPVYVANFVLMDYGTGAIFGCPAHDQRDLDFAHKYDLRNTPVVCPPDADPTTFDDHRRRLYRRRHASINSGFLDGLTIDEAKEEIAERLEQRQSRQPSGAQRQVNYRLRDWGISRQRYWGCPIPVIHCEDCGVVPVPDEGPAGRAARRRRVRPARQSARPSSDLEARHLPAMRRPGAARDRHHGHVRRFVVVLRPLHRSADRRHADRPRHGRSPGCRSTSISAASSTRSCICSIRASSPAP